MLAQVDLLCLSSCDWQGFKALFCIKVSFLPKENTFCPFWLSTYTRNEDKYIGKVAPLKPDITSASCVPRFSCATWSSSVRSRVFFWIIQSHRVCLGAFCKTVFFFGRFKFRIAKNYSALTDGHICFMNIKTRSPSTDIHATETNFYQLAWRAITHFSKCFRSSASGERFCNWIGQCLDLGLTGFEFTDHIYNAGY